jgi:hypothetical protein
MQICFNSVANTENLGSNEALQMPSVSPTCYVVAACYDNEESPQILGVYDNPVDAQKRQEKAYESDLYGIVRVFRCTMNTEGSNWLY